MAARSGGSLEALSYSSAGTYTHVGPSQVHGEGAAEFPLVPQLPQGELLQDLTVAPSTHSHNAGLLTSVNACEATCGIAGLRRARLTLLR